MNPVYAGLVLALTFAALIWFILSGQPMHLTVTFVIVTLGLGLGAAYIMSREQAREGAYADGEDGDDFPATNEAMNFAQIPDAEAEDAEN